MLFFNRLGKIDEASIISPPQGHIEYDCRTKKGLLGLRWTSYNKTINLAKMNINLSDRK